jgi:hypothetical protein
MVPKAALPPATALTLQITEVSVAPVTVAEKVCEAPSSSEALAGVTLTVTAGGGGSGGPTTAELLLAALPAQPRAQTAKARTARLSSNAVRGWAALRN